VAALRAARDALGAAGVTVVRSSSVFETAPQGEVTDQPDFLNACVEIETDLGPDDLLDVCKQVERDLGRVSGGPRHGPRPIDVDVLLLGDLERHSERLTLPHAGITARRFVLDPLLELDPELALPGGEALAGFAAAVAGQPVRRLSAL